MEQDLSLQAGLEEVPLTADQLSDLPVAEQTGELPVMESKAEEAAIVLPQGPFLRIPVTVQVVLGTRRMPLSEVMALAPGSVVALDQELSQPVRLQVNGNEVARGTLSIVDEATGQLGITLTAIAAPSRNTTSA